MALKNINLIHHHHHTLSSFRFPLQLGQVSSYSFVAPSSGMTSWTRRVSRCATTTRRRVTTVAAAAATATLRSSQMTPPRHDEKYQHQDEHRLLYHPQEHHYQHFLLPLHGLANQRRTMRTASQCLTKRDQDINGASSTVSSTPSSSSSDPGTSSSSSPPSSGPNVEVDWDSVLSKLDKVIKDHPLVLFMKGSPSSPECGYSARVCIILSEIGCDDYTFVDVMKHPIVREGIKKLSNWPTIPQLYAGGEFVGGCDIINQMYENGELADLLKNKKDSEDTSNEKERDGDDGDGPRVDGDGDAPKK